MILFNLCFAITFEAKNLIFLFIFVTLNSRIGSLNKNIFIYTVLFGFCSRDNIYGGCDQYGSCTSTKPNRMTKNVFFYQIYHGAKSEYYTKSVATFLINFLFNFFAPLFLDLNFLYKSNLPYNTVDKII